MSEFQPPDYLDDSTRIIVPGYIRESQQLLTCSLFHHVPREISLITLCYVDDHFMMNRGSYQWKIRNPKIIQNILTAQHNQGFTSSMPFKIGKLPWIMKIFPNGHTATNSAMGRFAVFTEILSFPRSWDTIYINQSIELKYDEISNKFVFNANYKTAEDYWGSNELILVNDLINANPKILAFTVSMKILRITHKIDEKTYLKHQFGVNNYRKHYELKWKIDPNKTGPQFSNIIGEMFCANYSSSTSNVRLRICGLPNKQQTGYDTEINALQIKWTLIINDSDIKYTTVGKLGYDDKLSEMSSLLIPAFDNDDNDEIELKVNIEILAEYDFSGVPIGIDVEREWDEFLLNENGKLMKTKRHRTIKKKIISDNVIKTKGLGNDMESQWQYGMLSEILRKMDCMEKEIKAIKACIINNKTTDNDLEEFRIWLKNEVKLGQYFSILVENGFDTLDAITTINIEQLKEIGINKIGHRQKLMKHIQWLEI